MNKSNPFVPEGSIATYVPDIEEAELAMVDSALREEIDSGRLEVRFLNGATWQRIASGYQRSI